jgi:hypothetical protein
MESVVETVQYGTSCYLLIAPRDLKGKILDCAPLQQFLEVVVVVLIPEVYDIITKFFIRHDLLPSGVILKELVRTRLEDVTLVKSICVSVEEMSASYKILPQLLGNLDRRHLIDAIERLGFLIILVIKGFASL